MNAKLTINFCCVRKEIRPEANAAGRLKTIQFLRKTATCALQIVRLAKLIINTSTLLRTGTSNLFPSPT